ITYGIDATDNDPSTTARTVTLNTVTDNGGGANTNTDISATATISVTAVNDAPVNTVPSAQNTDEDTTLTFNTANANLISINDIESDEMTVVLSVANGTLTLSQLTGLTVLGGANGTSTVTITGTIADINAALDGLQYTPTANYNGNANLTLTTYDASPYSLNDANQLAHFEFDSGDAANDSSLGGTNNGTITGATSEFDIDRNSDVLVFDGDDELKIDGQLGTPTDVTLAGWVKLDAGNNSDEFITLGRVIIRLDTDSNGVTGYIRTGEAGWDATTSSTNIAGTGWHHIAYTVDDGNNVQVIYLDGVALGTTNFTESINWTVSSDSYIGRHAGGSDYWLHGAVDDVRIYDKALSAAEVAALATDDVSQIDTDTITITVNPVNDNPTNAGSLPTDISVTEDVSSNVDLSTIDLSDVDAASGSLTVTLTTSTGGDLTASTGGGVTVGGSGTGVLTLDGTVADLNTFLNTASNITYLHDTANTNGDNADTIQVNVNDNGNTGSGGGLDVDLGTVNVDITPVNDAPTLTATAADDSLTENTDTTSAAVFSTVTIDPVEPGDDIISAQLTIGGGVENTDTLTINGTAITNLGSDSSGAIAGGHNYSYAQATGMVTIAFTGTNAAAAELVLENITYGIDATDNDPSTTARTVTLNTVTDNGGGAN
ncbi:MAG: LamG domain-containing protein, partial [Gammaproteobacteria bacterium]|nr:LamG domain-containing protein [Gammaproteobacteria bacterium]